MSDAFQWLVRAYSELLDAPNGGLNFFRNAIFFGERINTYVDAGFMDYILTQPIANALPEKGKCVIADFGCGSGHVGYHVASQLTRPKRPVFPIGFDNYDKNFWLTNPTPKILTYQRDLKSLRFMPNMFHAGILRFALPFVHKKFQPDALKQIHAVLKPGAILVVLQDGVFNKTKPENSWNTLFAACGTFERLHGLHYPSCDSLQAMAKKAGFRVKAATDLTDIAFGYLSPESCAKAFKLTPKEHQRLNTLFQKWRQKNVLPFEPDPNSLRVLWPMYTCVLQK